MTANRNIRLLLAYDGSEYCGWQEQTNGLSLQTVLEKAVLDLTGEASRVVGSGRTDSGVHAIGQVANFLTHNTRIPVQDMRRGLERFLPRDITVLRVEEAPLRFHARFQAKRKQYRYVIDNSPAPLPFLRKYAYAFFKDLDVSAMHAAAQSLIGTHDFRSFESRWPNLESSVRTVMQTTVTRTCDWPIWSPGEISRAPAMPGGNFIYFDITADGFLYNMVRSIMGTLLEVGRGRWPVDSVARIMTAQNRSQAGTKAPPEGLYLMRVDYDDGGKEDLTQRREGAKE